MSNAATRHVALARGVNVGGANKLPMGALREIFEAAGASHVETIIQSGNVVFDAKSEALPGLIAAVRGEIQREYGFESRWVTRSAARWREAIAGNPFLAGEAELSHLHLAALSAAPDPARSALDPNRSPGDEFRLVGDLVYLRLPNGVGRSKLTNAWFDASLGVVSTIRNWATVTKIGAALSRTLDS